MHFRARFSSVEGRCYGAADLGGLEIPHGQQQSQIVPLDPHQDGNKQGRDVVASPVSWRPLDRFPVIVANRTCLANLSWDIPDTCSAGLR